MKQHKTFLRFQLKVLYFQFGKEVQFRTLILKYIFNSNKIPNLQNLTKYMQESHDKNDKTVLRDIKQYINKQRKPK